jgi:hypothetical protein
MIWKRPAKVEPVVSSLMEVWMVSVLEKSISPDAGSGVAHSLQNFESEGLTLSHLGHFMAR